MARTWVCLIPASALYASDFHWSLCYMNLCWLVFKHGINREVKAVGLGPLASWETWRNHLPSQNFWFWICILGEEAVIIIAIVSIKVIGNWLELFAWCLVQCRYSLYVSCHYQYHYCVLYMFWLCLCEIVL